MDGDGWQLVLAGALITVVAACYKIVMVGAAVFVHIPNGVFVVDNGWEQVGAIAALESTPGLRKSPARDGRAEERRMTTKQIEGWNVIDEDARLARLSLLEGDAMLVMAAFAADENHVPLSSTRWLSPRASTACAIRLPSAAGSSPSVAV